MKTLSFSDEQTELRNSLRRMISERWSAPARRAWLAGGEPYDRKLWADMAGQLGVHGLSIPESHGGLGYGFAEQAVVLEEIGRQVVATPYLSTAVIAPAVLVAGESAAADRWLPELAAGAKIAALAHTEADGDWWQDRPLTTWADADGDCTVTGTKHFVVDGAEADLLLVTASGADGELAVLAVEAGSATVTATALPTLDLTRRLATVAFDRAPAAVLARGRQARELLARARNVAEVGLACEQVGGCAVALELTVDYVKVREQFDAPIGSFQAVKFAAADMLLALESARSAAYYAADAIARDAPDAAVSCAVAKAVCSESYSRVTGAMIQLHGGIGYTWEHDAHLYFKRAKASEHLFGDPAGHRARLAGLLGL